jgi:hypothetical protein
MINLPPRGDHSEIYRPRRYPEPYFGFGLGRLVVRAEGPKCKPKAIPRMKCAATEMCSKMITSDCMHYVKCLSKTKKKTNDPKKLKTIENN